MINCPHIFAGTTRWRSTNDAKSRSIRITQRPQRGHPRRGRGRGRPVRTDRLTIAGGDRYFATPSGGLRSARHGWGRPPGHD